MHDRNRSIISYTCAFGLLLSACSADEGDGPRGLQGVSTAGSSPATGGPAGSTSAAGTGSAGQPGVA
ncbi:MAG TPA: hypothetical protein VJV78_21720, partial [Polyangiales bacterium]|nr:hypothetical protein [Polyangiales bacterium]